MDKSRVCMSRTINLATQKNVTKTNLLVYEKASATPCPPQPTCGVPKILSPQAKRIRVCTGAELKRVCQPPPCVCPPELHPLGIVGRILQLLGFGLKAAFAGSLVYWSWEAGIWGDSEETEMFYTNVCHMISTGQKRSSRRMSESCEAELELMQVPSPPEDPCLKPPFNKERTVQKIQETWNRAVTSIFEGVVGFPHNIINWYKKKTAEVEDICTPVKDK